MPNQVPAHTGRGRMLTLALLLAPIGLLFQWVALCVAVSLSPFIAPAIPFALAFLFVVTRRRRVRTRPAIAPRSRSRPAARRRTRTH